VSPQSFPPPSEAAIPLPGNRFFPAALPEAGPEARAAWKRVERAVFWAVLGAGLLFYHGQLVSSDEILMTRLSVSLASRASLFFPETYNHVSSPYGILCSLLGVPWFWVQDALYQLGIWRGTDPPALITLSNMIIAALMAALMVRFGRRMGAGPGASAAAALLLALATPFFPYQNSFFSEPATALAILAAAWCLGLGRESREMDSRRNLEQDAQATGLSRGNLLWGGLWMGVAIHLRIITGVLWPFWAALAWVQDSRAGVPAPKRLARLGWLAIFPAAAVLARLILNAAQYGSPWRMGYETSAFTTPLFVGLYGLLVSPERGLFLQAPLAILLPAAWASVIAAGAGVGAGGRMSLTARFAAAAFLLWTLLHAAFWTWHGGWTPGPRFMLPILPLGFLAMPLWLSGWRQWGISKRLGFSLFALWGAALAILQTLVNPLDWNNQVFSFLQSETPLFFAPGVSSLRGCWVLLGEGALRPVVWTAFIRNAASPTPLAALVIPAAGLIALWIALRKAGGIRRAAALCASAWRAVGDWAFHQNRAASALFLSGVIVVALARAASGPRGIQRETIWRDPAHSDVRWRAADFDKALRYGQPAAAPQPAPQSTPPPESAEEAGNENSPRVWSETFWDGSLDLPLEGEYTFFVKASGVYRLEVAGKIVAENDDAAKPQHLQRATARLSPGVYPIRLRVGPNAEGGALFHLYWKWPGEGRALEPFDKEYLLPRPLSALERAATKARRHSVLFLALLLGLGILMDGGFSRMELTEVGDSARSDQSDQSA